MLELMTVRVITVRCCYY